MDIFSHHLPLFMALCTHRSFTLAAKAVSLSQPAFSKRIAQLEATVGHTLFLRSRTGATLTPEGERLRRYAEEILGLERSYRRGEDMDVRIAAFSTALRSCLLPALSRHMRAHRDVRVHAFSTDLPSIVPRLLRAEVDIGVLIGPVVHPLLEVVDAWHEHNVLARSRRYRCDPGVYLDSDEADTTSIRYTTNTGAPRLERRLFYGDIYAMLDACALGVGRVVAPMHLVRADKRLEIVRGTPKLKERVQVARLRPLSTLRKTSADAIFRLIPSLGP
jgi:DNA-binding transcriptional LysR family regulator